MRQRIITASIGVLALASMLGASLPVSAATATATTRVTGTLQALSANTLPATLTVKAGATIYTVEVSSSTTIVRRYNGTSDLGEFLIGDSVEVRGTLSNDIANTLTATYLKNLAVQRVGGTFKGKVVQTNCSNNSFTYKPDGRVQQTVYFTSTTKFLRGGVKIGCASLEEGERAKVIGLWRRSENRIDADRVIVDMRTIAGTISEITLTDGGLPATIIVGKKVKVKTSSLKSATSDSDKPTYTTTTEYWTVQVTSSTRLFRHYMKSASIEEFLVGDKVEVRGTLSGDKTINAKSVRNSSLKLKRGDIQGTVLSVGSDGKTFTLRTKEKSFGDLRVTVTTVTKYVDENGLRSFADISVGDRLKVLGAYATNTKKLTAERVFFKDAQDEASVEDDE